MAVISIFGAGKMGEAMLAGLLRDGAGAHRVLVVEKSEDRARELSGKYAIEVVSTEIAAGLADFAFIIVKPQDVLGLLQEIGPRLRAETVVVSLAAGLTTARLESKLATGQPVVRVMPNTPALVGKGMSVLSAGSACSESQLESARGLLAAVGATAVVPEDLQDAVTAVSGSGPAYFFLFAEAMISAAEELGLERSLAQELVVQTVAGAGAMLEQTGESAEQLRANVTSPNGTTAAAIAKFEDSGLREAVKNAMLAARNRSQELAAD